MERDWVSLLFFRILLLRSIYVEVGSRAEKMDFSLKDAEKLASHIGFSSCSESNLQPRPGSRGQGQHQREYLL